MSDNKETVTFRDEKGYKVLYKTDIATLNAVIELNVKESSRIRFIEVVRIENNQETKITVSRNNFDEFVMALKNMLTYSTLNTKSSSNTTGSKQNKRFGLKTEMKTAEKWYYVFELVLDNDTRVLHIYCDRGNYRTVIILPVSELEEFITKCEIILKTFGDITTTNAESSTKYTPTKKARHDRDDWPEHSYNHTNRTSLNVRSNGGRSNRLEVLDNPRPRQIDFQDKSLILETVEGNKTFLRITEKINGKIKESVHVPIECMETFVKVVHDISNETKKIEENGGNP